MKSSTVAASAAVKSAGSSHLYNVPSLENDGTNFQMWKFCVREHGDSGSDEDGTFITVSPGNAEHAILPLPSYIGLPRCGALELNGLVEEELQLRQGQANDALHEI